MAFTDEMSLTKLAALLGVDELVIGKASMGAITISARLGGMWMSTSIEMETISVAKNQPETIGEILSDLTVNLKRAVAGDAYFARGEVKRESEQPRPQNRFEAVVEELKKL